MNESIEFLKHYCQFDDPDKVWMLKGCSRNKDNEGNANMHRMFNRYVLTCEKDIEECYAQIKAKATDPETNYRIYVSLNSRNVVRALFQYQKKLVSISEGIAFGQDDQRAMTKKLGSLWKTELEQKKCRGTKRILLDIDNREEHPTDLIEFTGSQISWAWVLRKTVSGWAYVIDACDTREIVEYAKENGYELDIQRDSMLFVEAFNGSKD